ncbi:MAG: hypothetical protein ACM65L_15685 [Microcoleus sp.]
MSNNRALYNSCLQNAAVDLNGLCLHPASAPDFLKPKPEELTNNLSCGEMEVLNVQSESVNVRVVTEVADYLYRIGKGNLKQFVTYFDLESRTARSIYITQQLVYPALISHA